MKSSLDYVDSNSICLFYIPEENIFIDEDGIPVFNIFDYVPPWFIDEFKDKKEEVMVYERSRTECVEVYYPVVGWESRELEDLKREFEYKMHTKDAVEREYTGPLESYPSAPWKN